ncbi:MAG: DUF2007 domain-containing protein [Dehalococcoidales bacterium]|nr:DUF2007 domain-containing protein [Dehalococcoidales bacterium]
MKYCPKCGCGHQDWVKLCSECKTELVDKFPPDIKTPPKEKNTSEPSEKLVPIASFDYPETANLASTKLESEGIWSFVANEHIVTANRFYSYAVGGVKLMVRESDAAEATRILNIVEPPPENTLPEDVCPRCHSSKIRYEPYYTLPTYILLILTFPINGSLGTTLPFIKRKWKCNTCGYQWKK